jgi:hypothetical protein
MKQDQQRILDSFRRIQDFLDAHADQVAALKDSAGRKQLDDAVTQISAADNAQGTANLTMTGQISREKSLIDDLRVKHMRPIMVFARARLRGVPDFAALTKSPAKLQPKPLVRAARAMATAAAPYANTFQEGGLPNDTVAELNTAADALDTAITDRANTKVGRVKATNGIGEELKLGKEAVGMLSAVITRQFADDKTFLAAWRAARRVTLKIGGLRGATTGTASQSTAPETTTSLKPVVAADSVEKVVTAAPSVVAHEPVSTQEVASAHT